MKYVLMLGAGLLLSACGDDDKSAPKTDAPKAEMSAEQRADNPLLKMQDDTVKKAEDSVNSAVAKQQEALDKVGQ